MSASRITPVVALLALSVACQEQPTAVNSVDNLEPQLINTDKGKWVPLAFPPPVDWTFVFTGPCVPEPLACEGSSIGYGLEHSPPKKANNFIVNFKAVYGEDTHCTGAQTGRWDMTTRSSGHIMTKPSDGKEYWHGIANDLLTNANTGDKVHFQANFWYVWNPSFPNLESFRIKESCGPRSKP